MGVHQKGSHFPICVFTNNVGRRSPKKLEERRQKQKQSQWRGSQWWPATQMQRQGSQERPPWRARPQQGSQADADPPQGWQQRSEERPAVAGDYMPTALDRWRAKQTSFDRSIWSRNRWRLGRRGANTSCSQASSETWAGMAAADAGQLEGTMGSWREPWAASDAGMWPATAVAGPSLVLQPWWRTESDGHDELTPLEAFQRSLAQPSFVSRKLIPL